MSSKRIRGRNHLHSQGLGQQDKCFIRKVDLHKDIGVVDLAYWNSAIDRILETAWVALIRIWSPWLAPRQGESFFAVDKETVTCSFLSNNGKHIG